MKKLLPTSNTTRGFTLVELMVVIAIVGILAVVSFGVFSGAQGSARDARREAEIDSLSKNIESTRDPQNGTYQYTSTLMARDYPTNSGLGDPGSYVYCEQASTSSTPPADPSAWIVATCPAGWSQIGGTSATPNQTVAANGGAGNDLTDIDIKGWKVCASLERSNKAFCKSNLIR